MRLRTQLLLLGLATLVLPWAGWQFARGVEASLLEGQSRALADTASAVARVLSAQRLALPPPGDAFYAAELSRPIALDGLREEWQNVWPDAVAFGGEQATLRVAFARYGAATHTFVEHPATHALRIAFDDGGGVRSYRVDVQPGGGVRLAGDGEAVAPVVGVWRDADGVRALELRFAPTATPRRIGIASVGDGAAVGTEPDRLGGLWPLLSRDASATAKLRETTPDGLQLRLLHPQGWILAQAGALDPLPSQPPSPWQRALVKLVADAGNADIVRSPQRVAAAQEISTALAGEAVSRWHRTDDGLELRLLAYAPVRFGDQARAVLEVSRRSEAAALANEALSGLLGASVLAMLVLGGVLFAYASWLGLRIRRLGQSVDAAREARPGEAGGFVASTAPDEIGDLSRRFARLLEEVAGHTEYLRTLAGKLSHELNTPLAIARSSLENLAGARGAEAEVYRQRARDGIERMQAIVRAMSEATRIERAISSAEGEDFDLRQLVAGCAEGYRPLVAPRRLELLLPDAPMPFHGAPDLLAQALDKLVENAISFCPEDGWIAVAAAAHDGMVEIGVANAGPALPEMAPARLFDSLVSVRAGGQRKDGTPHLGLGLHVVRLVVELHRGRAAARNLGHGVEFRLTLAGMPRGHVVDTPSRG